MKVYYLNDEQKPITVRVMDAKFDCVNFTGDSYTVLQSCEGKEFEVELPPGTVLYIKKWPNMVMLSFYALPTTDPVQPEQPLDQQEEGSS